jgi:hypothetical protein
MEVGFHMSRVPLDRLGSVFNSGTKVLAFQVRKGSVAPKDLVGIIQSDGFCILNDGILVQGLGEESIALIFQQLRRGLGSLSHSPSGDVIDAPIETQ